MKLNMNSSKIMEKFSKVRPKFKKFLDSNYQPSKFKISLHDCLKGVEFSIKMMLFKPLKFSNEKYIFLNKIENGYINWIIPKKVLILASPCEITHLKEDYIDITSENLIPILKKERINLLIRTNKKVYNFKDYKKSGITCIDLYYNENENPSISIIKKFLKIIENHKGAFAIQSRTGLRRSAVLAAIYLMRAFFFSAKQAIAWIRIIKPGSVSGFQQNFLMKLEKFFCLNVNDSKLFRDLSDNQKRIAKAFEKFK